MKPRPVVLPATLPVVAVYREMLLSASEPYIRSQGEGLTRYRSHYIGAHRVRGLELPSERTFVIRDCHREGDRVLNGVFRRLPDAFRGRTLRAGNVIGRAGEAAFKLAGVSPCLYRALRAMRPAVLHAHTGIGGAHALPLSQKLNIPLVVTFHGYDATATDEEMMRWRDRGRVYLRRREALKRDATTFVAVSEFIRRQMLERGFPEEKIVVHYIGVDTTFFAPEPGVAREPIVLFVGRMIEKKGAAHLIEAMRGVQARVPDAELVFVGSGELQSRLESQSRAAAIRVRFAGTLSPGEVRAWMNRARVFCVPSITASSGDAEAFGIVFAEAQCMGLPVVSSSSGGIPEAVEHGVTGLLARERDSEALAAHIEMLLTDRQAWERMSAAGMKRVRERFDLGRQTPLLEDIYDAARC